MSNTKDVSIVLGTYNRKRFLKLTIDSVRRELENSDLNYEIIVVDGGSTDGTIKWLTRQKDIISIIQYNRGIWGNKKIERRSWGYFMNLGFKCAQGKYICMLSDDCLIIPGAIKNGINQFERELIQDHLLAGIAFYYREFPVEKFYCLHRIFKKYININHGLFSKNALKNIDYADESSFNFYCADFDLSMRLINAGYSIIPAEQSFVEHCHFLRRSKIKYKKYFKNNINNYEYDKGRFIRKWHEYNENYNINNFSDKITNKFQDITKTYKKLFKLYPWHFKIIILIKKLLCL